MLPDLPKVKQKLEDAFLEYFRNKVNERMGVFSTAPRHIVHEGEEVEVTRADGISEVTEIHSAEAEWSLNHSDVPTMSIGDRLAKLNVAAEAMAKEISKGLFQSLDQSLVKAGRTLDGGGRSFDIEAVFQGLESIEWNFRPDGRADEISLVIPPALRDKARLVLSTMQSDPNIQRRYEALMEKKRMEWREREATRKLVG